MCCHLLFSWNLLVFSWFPAVRGPMWNVKIGPMWDIHSYRLMTPWSWSSAKLKNVAERTDLKKKEKNWALLNWHQYFLQEKDLTFCNFFLFYLVSLESDSQAGLWCCWVRWAKVVWFPSFVRDCAQHVLSISAWARDYKYSFKHCAIRQSS